MHVGIGIPTRDGALGPGAIVDWAKRAEAAGFSSLAVLDRVVFPLHEPLVTLATVAGATDRIRLLASIVIGPTRESTLLARQAASLDGLSGGRFSLGVGVGVRRDDYAATGQPFERRGKRLDEQLTTLRRIWAGVPIGAEELGPIGARAARPRGPELLIGGYVDAVVRRIVEHGDGFMAPGGGVPEKMASLWADVRSAWTAADRPGTPRWVGSSYVALGPDADRQAREYIEATYAFDPALAERRLRSIPQSVAAVQDIVERHAAMGVDEFVFRPCAADPDLVDRLWDAVASLPVVRPGPAELELA
ncbi:MAG TPA: LLM class flavin-dependent oxidoreductase [Candidatus Limnocylindrales bacterium]|nr:LLM class flavin-dependent oxidoreductase [Candidatus Limnocylindrales bacterium]